MQGNFKRFLEKRRRETCAPAFSWTGTASSLTNWKKYDKKKDTFCHRTAGRLQPAEADHESSAKKREAGAAFADHRRASPKKSWRNETGGRGRRISDRRDASDFS